MNPDIELKYLGIIDSLGQIPTLPVVVTQLLKVINHPNSGADNAAAFVEKDIALASKVLKLANSSYYGIPRTITNIKSAIVILGFNAIKSLVLSSSVLKIFEEKGEQTLFDKNAFWNHSVEVAMMAKSLARKVRGADYDQAFSGGLLHDIGKLILAQYSTRDYQEVLGEVTQGKRPSEVIEQEILGITHCKISGMLLERWGIPEALQIPVSFHDQPTKAEDHVQMAHILHLANYLSYLKGSYTVQGELAPELNSETLESLGFQQTPEELLENISGDLSEVAEFIALIQGSEGN